MDAGNYENIRDYVFNEPVPQNQTDNNQTLNPQQIQQLAKLPVINSELETLKAQLESMGVRVENLEKNADRPLPQLNDSQVGTVATSDISQTTQNVQNAPIVQSISESAGVPQPQPEIVEKPEPVKRPQQSVQQTATFEGLQKEITTIKNTVQQLLSKLIVTNDNAKTLENSLLAREKEDTSEFDKKIERYSKLLEAMDFTPTIKQKKRGFGWADALWLAIPVLLLSVKKIWQGIGHILMKCISVIGPIVNAIPGVNWDYHSLKSQLAGIFGVTMEADASPPKSDTKSSNTQQIPQGAGDSYSKVDGSVDDKSESQGKSSSSGSAAAAPAMESKGTDDEKKEQPTAQQQPESKGQTTLQKTEQPEAEGKGKAPVQKDGPFVINTSGVDGGEDAPTATVTSKEGSDNLAGKTEGTQQESKPPQATVEKKPLSEPSAKTNVQEKTAEPVRESEEKQGIIQNLFNIMTGTGADTVSNAVQDTLKKNYPDAYSFKPSFDIQPSEKMNVASANIQQPPKPQEETAVESQSSTSTHNISSGGGNKEKPQPQAPDRSLAQPFGTMIPMFDKSSYQRYKPAFFQNMMA